MLYDNPCNSHNTLASPWKSLHTVLSCLLSYMTQIFQIDCNPGPGTFLNTQPSHSLCPTYVNCLISVSMVSLSSDYTRGSALGRQGPHGNDPEVISGSFGASAWNARVAV